MNYIDTMESRKRRITDVTNVEVEDADTVTKAAKHSTESSAKQRAKYSYKAIPKSLNVEIDDEVIPSLTPSHTPSQTPSSTTTPFSVPRFSAYNTNPLFKPFTQPATNPATKQATTHQQTPIIKLSNSSQNTSMDNISGNVDYDDEGDGSNGIAPRDIAVVNSMCNNITPSTPMKRSAMVNITPSTPMKRNGVIPTRTASAMVNMTHDIAKDPYFDSSRANYNNDIVRDVINKVMNKHINVHLKNSNHIVLKVNQRVRFEKKVENDTLTINLNDL